MLMMTTTPDDGSSEFWSNRDFFGDPSNGFDDTVDLEFLFRNLDESNTPTPPPPTQHQQLEDPSQINSLNLSGKNAPNCWSSVDFINLDGSCSHADALSSPAVGTSYLNIGNCGLSSENSAETVEVPKIHLGPYPTELSLIESNEASCSGSVNVITTEVCRASESVTADRCSVMQPYWSADAADFSGQQLHNSTSNQFFIPNSGDMLTTLRDGVEDYPSCLNGKIVSMNLFGGTNSALSEDSTIDFFVSGSDSVESVAVNSCSSGNTSPYEVSTQPLHWTLLENPRQSLEKSEMNIEPFFINSMKHLVATSVAQCGGSFVGFDAGGSVQEFVCSGQMSPLDTKTFLPCWPPPKSSFTDLLHSDDSNSMKEGLDHARTQLTSVSFGPSRVEPEVIWGQTNSIDNRSNDDDDIAEISGIEYHSQCASASASLAHQKPLTHQPTSTPLRIMGISGSRLKHDEHLIYQAALQDLSQPKSEASLPEGVLAVPLLRHQRIALSWMVQKETANWQCSGGILADDQGLGKTISTIALILKERRPSAKTISDMEKTQPETLDLDEDDGHLPKSDILMKNGDEAVMSQTTSHVAKGRPAAGTLIVCPTSVLRQWADELHNKVTSKAHLSVLQYHGSNRTKDPYELAQYDVVITTYAIVSMEVPKQSRMEKDEKRMLLSDDVPPFTSSKKRKHSPNFDKRSSKKGLDGAHLDFKSCPLAKVGWFRVVLDEAQSIKNYRTRVAQACWGLRAKRRWCLSGTPIQNAVDDLYSYFRFLRYDPYAAYTSFCSMVKAPISKNPSNGYKKLQAVLKTIMLRRTKGKVCLALSSAISLGTLLDGKPIITLPPKSVNLKKVEFSNEERDFYMKLEADSRAKFQDYAASGTVEQNYVNILLMLLRLRQACDHPLLVGGYDSSSVLQSSLHMARKLPQKQQSSLLNCLEASLAICCICSDPPEDAVVSKCGHVFCNQCISEHLVGDDNQCPVINCKVPLNISSVFSGAALKHCLNDQLSQTEFSNGTAAVGPCLGDRLFESSKIKAALGVLQSLNEPQESILDDGLVEPKDCDSCSSMDPLIVPGSPELNKCPKDSVSVVREKAIVFSQWTKMLDLLESCLKGSSIKYRRLDGTMPVAARDKAVRDFNTIPEITVMIMSLKAASLGLNMVAACHVILLDLWWNPTTEDQAIDRAHRIGQTRPVTVVRLTVKDTVEDRILALQQKKREMVASAFGEEEMGSRQTRLTVDDLKYLFMGRNPGAFSGTVNHTFQPT